MLSVTRADTNTPGHARIIGMPYEAREWDWGTEMADILVSYQFGKLFRLSLMTFGSIESIFCDRIEIFYPRHLP
jgi:hypothetical protein